MWQQKLKRSLKVIMGIVGKILNMIWKIIKRVIQLPGFKRSLSVSLGVLSITVILAVGITGLLNYKLDTSTHFPFILPPAGESMYYIESTPENLWNTFLSPYSIYFDTQSRYIGRSFIIKNLFMSEYRLSRRYETYIIIDDIKFIFLDPSGLQQLKKGDIIDITGVCVGVPEKEPYITVGNCQLLPAGLVSLPLPGGPAPLSSGY